MTAGAKFDRSLLDPVKPPLTLAEALDRTAATIRRFVVVNEAQRDTLALWIAHTYAIDAADTTPYIAITSAEKRSGKTRLLETLEMLVKAPMPVANISDAALFRAVAELQPTLLFDEVDAIFGPKSRDREDLRGMLNAGYKRGAFVYRMGGAKMTTLEPFAVFAAKALAGIGELPDTIADRSIAIRLERRLRDEQVDRFRRRLVAPAAEELRGQLCECVEPQLDHLRALEPHLPDELDDRAQDVWEPLLALADIAGVDWPQRARRAALDLSTGVEREDASLTTQLLADIAIVFAESGHERMKTSTLIEGLAGIEESPWGDWHGKPITAHALSRLLKRYRIRTMPVWVDGQTVKGYKAEQFEDACTRVGVRWVREVRSEAASEAAPNSPNPPNPEEAKAGAAS